jgi:hypothetical protein
MGQDLRSIVISALGIILAGVVLRLIDRKWVKERKGFLSSVVPAGIGMIIVILSVIVVYRVVWPGPDRGWQVEGLVIDKYGNVAVRDARVTIESLSAKTGNEGRFLIRYDQVPVHEVEINVERDGYAPWRGFVPINEFEKIELDTLPNTR